MDGDGGLPTSLFLDKNDNSSTITDALHVHPSMAMQFSRYHIATHTQQKVTPEPPESSSGPSYSVLICHNQIYRAIIHVHRLQPTLDELSKT